MRDGESVADKLDDPYRMMCPEHHHDLYDTGGRTVYCGGCGHAWRYADLVDKAETRSRSVVPPASGSPSLDPRE